MTSPQFNHEKLTVYRLALDFISWLTPVLQEARKNSAPGSAIARDHLDRASLSVLYNIAEGNGKFTAGSRKSFFDIALGSATECAACLDSLVAKGLLNENRLIEGKVTLVRIVQMLIKLRQAQEDNGIIREPGVEYEIQEEDSES